MLPTAPAFHLEHRLHQKTSDSTLRFLHLACTALDTVHRVTTGFVNFPATSLDCRRNLTSPSTNLSHIKAKESPRMSSLKSGIEVKSNESGIITNSDDLNGSIRHEISTKGKRSTNIVWHKCSVEKMDRQELLQQKGCVVWITGLSGSGKSTLDRLSEWLVRVQKLWVLDRTSIALAYFQSSLFLPSLPSFCPSPLRPTARSSVSFGMPSPKSRMVLMLDKTIFCFLLSPSGNCEESLSQQLSRCRYRSRHVGLCL
ncbi:unnamed protein product [Lactuca virosa]|uniref:APS kinase domain-containing protein n=1 Tax=Lactuca virosa TaxID=75947 RepID=A0AAU9NL87_9ASTR|nr:unnamed protein product [Lactuca virosa]